MRVSAAWPRITQTLLVLHVQIIELLHDPAATRDLSLQLVTHETVVMDLWVLAIIHNTGQDVLHDFFRCLLSLRTGARAWNLSQVSIVCKMFSRLCTYQLIKSCCSSLNIF